MKLIIISSWWRLRNVCLLYSTKYRFSRSWRWNRSSSAAFPNLPLLCSISSWERSKKSFRLSLWYPLNKFKTFALRKISSWARKRFIPKGGIPRLKCLLQGFPIHLQLRIFAHFSKTNSAKFRKSLRDNSTKNQKSSWGTATFSSTTTQMPKSASLAIKS